VTLALKLFVRVARLGSFSRAGLEFRLPQPSVSRIIRDLEREVGAALLTRSTRAVVPTEVGAEYLARVEPVLDALEDAVGPGANDLIRLQRRQVYRRFTTLNLTDARRLLGPIGTLLSCWRLTAARASVAARSHREKASEPDAASVKVRPNCLDMRFFLNRSNQFAVASRLPHVHRDHVALANIARYHNPDAVVVPEPHFRQMKPVFSNDWQIDLVITEYKRIVGCDQGTSGTRGRQLHIPVHSRHELELAIGQVNFDQHCARSRVERFRMADDRTIELFSRIFLDGHRGPIATMNERRECLRYIGKDAQRLQGCHPDDRRVAGNGRRRGRLRNEHSGVICSDGVTQSTVKADAPALYSARFNGHDPAELQDHARYNLRAAQRVRSEQASRQCVEIAGLRDGPVCSPRRLYPIPSDRSRVAAPLIDLIIRASATGRI
jgi:hypothetical protein